MKQAILRGILTAAFLLFPLAIFAETVTYYDCRNEDGSMTYRIFPCNKGQQETNRQEGTLGKVTPPQDHLIPTPGVQDIENVQRHFAIGEAAYKLEKFEEAVIWYRKAAEQGYAPAQYSLGAMYEKGQGVEKDYPQAAFWYRKAADQGIALAQFNMGVMYDIGQGVAQDYQQALSWYSKAAENGNVKAQNNLGFMYSQGKGVTRDYVIAHMWFNISGARGYEEGRKNREFVEQFMNPSQIAEAQRHAGEWIKAHP